MDWPPGDLRPSAFREEGLGECPAVFIVPDAAAQICAIKTTGFPYKREERSKRKETAGSSFLSVATFQKTMSGREESPYCFSVEFYNGSAANQLSPSRLTAFVR